MSLRTSYQLIMRSAQLFMTRPTKCATTCLRTYAKCTLGGSRSGAWERSTSSMASRQPSSNSSRGTWAHTRACRPVRGPGRSGDLVRALLHNMQEFDDLDGPGEAIRVDQPSPSRSVAEHDTARGAWKTSQPGFPPDAEGEGRGGGIDAETAGTFNRGSRADRAGLAPGATGLGRAEDHDLGFAGLGRAVRAACRGSWLSRSGGRADRFRPSRVTWRERAGPRAASRRRTRQRRSRVPAPRRGARRALPYRLSANAVLTAKWVPIRVPPTHKPVLTRL